jgi:hypothetical protein
LPYVIPTGEIECLRDASRSVSQIEIQIPQEVKNSGDDGGFFRCSLAKEEQQIDVGAQIQRGASIPTECKDGTVACQTIVLQYNRPVGLHYDRVNGGRPLVNDVPTRCSCLVLVPKALAFSLNKFLEDAEPDGGAFLR